MNHYSGNISKKSREIQGFVPMHMFSHIPLETVSKKLTKNFQLSQFPTIRFQVLLVMDKIQLTSWYGKYPVIYMVL